MSDGLGSVYTERILELLAESDSKISSSLTTVTITATPIQLAWVIGKLNEERNKAINGAFFDADHLATCAENMLAALNKMYGAQEFVELADLDVEGEPERAAAELEKAVAEVSEYWRAIQTAAYEYRKRVGRVRNNTWAEG